MSVSDELKKLFSLEGKIAVITGAAGGIGRALTKGLAACGAQIAAIDIDKSGLDTTMAELPEGNHKYYISDISDIANINNTVDQIMKDFGEVDVLINCAGITKRIGILDIDENTYDRIMSVNLKGVYFLTQHIVLASMMHNGGKIINIGSHTTTGMMGGVSVYGATKSAIYALTRSMCIEWAKFNIQANCIAPGHILTPLTTSNWNNKKIAKYLLDRIPMGRPGNPEELVGIAVLLAADASSYINGALFDIDGGLLAGGKPWEFETKY